MTRLAHLQRLLDEYRTEDAHELRYLERMRELLREGEAALSRGHYEPGHFTASAFVLAPDGERLLLILHAKLGLWLQPGGHLEDGDRDVFEAVRREVREEVGLEGLHPLRQGLFDVDVHDIPAGKEPAHQHFDLRFLFRATDAELRAGSDAKAARWVALGEVSAHQSDASVMRAVARLRAHTSRTGTAGFRASSQGAR